MVRNIFGVICIVLGLLLPVLAKQVVQQILVIHIDQIDRVGEEFVPPRGGVRAIFYPGEEIKLKIILFNDGDKADILLSSQNAKVTKHLAIQWIDLPNDVSKTALMVRPGEIYKGLNVNSSARIKNVTKLGPREKIAIELRVSGKDNSSLVPGHYELQVSYVIPAEIEQQMRWSKERLLVNTARFRFEVREPTTLEDRLEIMYRSATREYYFNQNQDKAVAQLRQLLTVYPVSSAVYYFLGHIASNSGDYVQAIKHFEKALQLLESNADTIRLKHMGSGSNKDHLIATLKGEIRLANEKLVRR